MSITLEQARKIVELGDSFQHALIDVDARLAAFLIIAGDMVQCMACARAPGLGDDYGRSARVEMLPVPKSAAVDALRRERSKIIAKLAELGVCVEET